MCEGSCVGLLELDQAIMDENGKEQGELEWPKLEIV